MILVIVESPTKAKTIKRYLGKDYIVLSSFGHVRDLPSSKMGVAVEKNYQPTYSISKKSAKALKSIKDTIQQKKIKKVILATDEDREGEAIAFHLKWIIKRYAPKMKFERITFHEITNSAITKALKNPRDINLSLFNAQQARRVLDRLVGYTLSPLLWKKIKYGLSAGRVQSVALRLIVEREREREKFKPKEYWDIAANFSKSGYEKKAQSDKAMENDPNIFLAQLNYLDPKKLKKFDIKDKKQAKELENKIKKKDYLIGKVSKKQTQKNPAPPFKTSTLQREAASKLGFSAKQTMMVAQQLYEGIKLDKGSTGLITYMRTDSLNIAPAALNKAREVILKKYGNKYVLEKPRYYTNQTKGAQEAHEAIRPSYPNKTPEEIKKYLNPKQFKLYNLIWQKFIASQMREAIFDKVNYEVASKDQKIKLLASGSVIKFDGFLKAYGQNFKIKETRLPELKEKEALSLLKVNSTQHFTQPPARYNDASLIKTLEQYGIGRPSTYAPTLSTIVDRGYVEKDENKQYFPKEIGYLVNDLMVENFSKVVDYEFSAQMESNLDKIAQGDKEWVKIIDDFYKPFSREVKTRGEKIKKYEKKIDKKCPKCKSSLVEKFGRFGKFYACSGYPECKYTEDPNQKENEKKDRELKKEIGEVKCEKCGAKMEIKRGRWGPFLGCSNYPECKNIKKIENSSNVTCPLCNVGEIVEKKSRKGIFWACNNFPDCRNAMNGKPTGDRCVQCNSLVIIDPKTGKEKCSKKGCNWKKGDS
ncbi:MAG: type I DNA topoisomerase [Candidatus Moranbacteria bacterium]|nr:type I DNA topoisomerase [Candidatus Moranbacteria bacterium]